MVEGLVKQLEYAASDENMQFCEALEIISKGKRHYVLHFFSLYPSPRDEKVEYRSRRRMLSDFPYGPGGFGDCLKTGWVKTDAQCGYSEVSIEEFSKAREIRLRKELSGLDSKV